MSGLSLTEVSVSYGPASALFGVSLDVEVGQTIGLLGRNGAGKTTTIKSVIADESATVTGGITLDTTSLRGLTTFKIARLGVAWVPDNRRIFTALSVAENLDLASRSGVSNNHRDKVLAAVPLVEKLLPRRGFELSGGEQQAVAIGRALMSDPNYLLLDEPTEGLAPLIVEQLQESIEKLPQEFNLGILIAEQNYAFLTTLATRVHILEAGRLVWTGTRTELSTAQGTVDRYLAIGSH